MKLPLELVDVLNWRDIGPIKNGQPSVDADAKATVDRLISTMYPVYTHLIRFGVDFHNFMDSNDTAGLLEFIEKYRNDGNWRLAKFAHGLQMDIEAVTNTLLYPDISNGMTEGINSAIKCDKRVCGGKAKIDLLTAKMVIRQSTKEKRKGAKSA